MKNWLLNLIKSIFCPSDSSSDGAAVQSPATKTILKIWRFPALEIVGARGSFHGVGTVEIYDDGKVSIRASFQSHIPFDKGLVTVKGVSEKGLHLLATDGHIVKHNFGTEMRIEVKPLRCQIFEPTQVNQPWTEQKFLLKNACFWNAGTFRADGFNFHLEMLPGINQHEIDHGQVTAILKVSSPSPTTDDPMELVFSVCQLLGLAHRCPILPVEQEASNSSGFCYANLNEMTQDFKSVCPLVDRFADDICAFVEKTYPSYKANNVSYEIGILIDYYCRAHVESYAQLKFLFAGVFMEALKFNWAKNLSTQLDPDIKSNGVIRAFYYKTGHAPTGKANRPLSFEDLMILVSTHLGYPAVASSPGAAGAPGAPGTFTFIEDRNAIFHSGQAAAAQQGHTSIWPILKPELYKLYDQMDDLLLRILNFNGKIYSPGNPDRPINFPSRTP